MKAIAIIYMAIVVIIWIVCIIAAVAITYSLKHDNNNIEDQERAGFGILSCSLFVLAMIVATIWPIGLVALMITMLVESRRKEE